MKKLYNILVVLLLIGNAWSQSPEKMSFQAVIDKINNKQVGMRISILQGSESGTSVYTETQTPTANNKGLVTLEIGTGITTDNFADINWGNGPYFIKTETDPKGGTNYTITGTSQLLSVPYALYAKTANGVNGTITASQISDLQTSITNNIDVLANSAKNSYPYADATKLAGIASGAEVNVNADWNAASGDAQILNKPTLAIVAESGSYNDLTNKPMGNNIGDMQYWDGTAWVILPRGIIGQVLTINSNNIPSWQNASATVLLAPTATTLAATNIQSFSAVINGTVNANNLSTNVVFEWGLTTDYENTSTSTKSTITGTLEDTVSAYLTGLQSATTYYYRIKANNAVNVTYSSDMSFTTALSAPQLTTTKATSISVFSAETGGNITYDGGSLVTTRGVCWSTSQNPIITDSHTIDGSGIGVFTSSITGLALNNTYYVRAYATNNIGTTYGNQISFSTGIGRSYQGGIIAYILKSGDPGYIEGQIHGLIAAPSDQSTSAEWGCSGTEITGADGTALGTGNQNTIDIVAGCTTEGIAAKICYDLVLNSYNDWYLPSKDELQKLYENRSAIGGFTNLTYWSSTESYTNRAWGQYFNGSGQYGYKVSLYCVRAVRTF
jgi:hypothetical protein